MARCDRFAVAETNLRLSDAEQIENFSRTEERRHDSQMLLIFGSVHGTISLVPSPVDYWMCTSDPLEEILRQQPQVEAVQLRDQLPNAARYAVFQPGTEHDHGV